MALALFAASERSAMAEPMDIQWFKDNAGQREVWLRQCQGDARFFDRNIGECRNALAADASTLGRPLRGAGPPRRFLPAPGMLSRSAPRAT